jgi:uncharacterized protein YlxW (UPF0749 family)
MKPQRFSNLGSRRNQKGWMMIEVLLCLALLAVVLHLAQGQSEVQWQSIQLAEEQRKLEENQQKQAAMVTLTDSVSWLSESNDQTNRTYPDCQQCTGNQLESWFYASQQSVSDVNQEDGE